MAECVEDLKTCPYNESHKVDGLRFAKHLQKCRMANRHMRIEICPFNSTHHIPLYMMEAHQKKCAETYNLSGDFFSKTSFTSASKNSIVAPSHAVKSDSGSHVEDWDAEISEQEGEKNEKFNPQINSIWSPYVRAPDASLGLGKAGRRKWREADIKRVQMLSIDQNADIGGIEYPTADGYTISIREIRENLNAGRSSHDCGLGIEQDLPPPQTKESTVHSLAEKSVQLGKVQKGCKQPVKNTKMSLEEPSFVKILEPKSGWVFKGLDISGTEQYSNFPQIKESTVLSSAEKGAGNQLGKVQKVCEQASKNTNMGWVEPSIVKTPKPQSSCVFSGLDISGDLTPSEAFRKPKGGGTQHCPVKDGTDCRVQRSSKKRGKKIRKKINSEPHKEEK